MEFGRLLRSIASESVVTPLYLCNTKHLFCKPCTTQLCLQTTLVQEKYEMNLKEYISNSSVNTYNKIENVILQLLHVLHELHSNNLTHGNITHSRIFVHNDTIKMTDLNYCIMHGKNIETPSRRPPEAIKYKFGKFTDMWALGELIFEMSFNFN
jgi:serine/threonine protein kinase